MKRILTTLMAMALVLSATLPVLANAIGFNVKGQWMMAFGVGDNSLSKEGRELRREDDFAVRQRIFLQLDARASENLSGTLQLHIGPQQWGHAATGGALGTDGTPVKVRQACIDWQIPNTSMQLRMGLQYFILPNAAGGSAIFDTRTAGIVGNYAFNDTVGLSAFWIRPFNDNFDASSPYESRDKNNNYLDNMDLWGLSLPVQMDGFSVTPWVMYGIQGRNAQKFADYRTNNLMDGYPAVTLNPWLNGLDANGMNVTNFNPASKVYGSMFWAGLPIIISAFEPWNFEIDLNYGFVESMGRYDAIKRNNPSDVERGSSQRQGWLVKALAEYKTDWGVPGIFAWYASGDDGNVKNGSERMPSLCAYGSFTSYLGDGNEHWGPGLTYFDHALNYAGTWGVGVQIRDVSLVENLSQTLRVAYWGGTNSPAMVKYMDQALAWDSTYMYSDGPYLTTNDGLLEVNFISKYDIYENLTANLELGYVANFIDNSTWKRGYQNWGSYSKQDMWKAQLLIKYSF